MRTKELIDLLNKYDPSGNRIVFVTGNGEPFEFQPLPCYYDGPCLEFEKQDEDTITGANVIKNNPDGKLVIKCLDIEDYISDNIEDNFEFESNIEFDFKETKYYNDLYQEYITKWKKFYAEFLEKRLIDWMCIKSFNMPLKEYRQLLGGGTWIRYDIKDFIFENYNKLFFQKDCQKYWNENLEINIEIEPTIISIRKQIHSLKWKQ